MVMDYVHSKTDTPSKLLGFLFIGTLSMLYSEVGSGASNLWFITPFGWLLTFVLYTLHTLFYFNIAIRWQKTSIHHLYLLGMLFALYEAPITQVLWSGYIEQEGPMWGTFQGIAWGEFLVLVFFWHPVMSFILPILTYELFVLEGNEKATSKSKIIPQHAEFLARLEKKKKWLYLFTILFSPFQLLGSGFDFGVSLVSILITMGLAILFKKLLSRLKRRKGLDQPMGLEDITLGKKGMVIINLLLVFWVYGFGSYAISTFVPGRWPNNIESYLNIALFALVVIILFISSPKSVELEKGNIKAKIEQGINLPKETRSVYPLNPARTVKRIWLIWVISTAVFSIISPVGLIVGFLMYVTMIPIGIILLGGTFRWSFNSLNR